VENRYRFTGHESVNSFGLPWYDCGSRYYNPLLGIFMGVDPQAHRGYIYNPYAYCANNPIKYVDPDGEFFWIPIAIGAAVGAVSGAMIGHANGATGWNMFGYIFAGAAIGGLSGGAGVSVGTTVAASVSGGFGGLIGGMVGGAVGGSMYGFYMGGLAGANPLETMLKGGLAGIVGGGIGGYIAGPLGAIAGGAAGGATGAALNGGSLGDILTSALIGGALAYGGYELSMRFSYLAAGKEEGTGLTYKNYRRLSIGIQRSFGRGRELPFAIDGEGNVRLGKLGTRTSCIPIDTPSDKIGGHTHTNIGGNWSETFSKPDDVFHMQVKYLDSRYQAVKFMVVGRQNIYSTDKSLLALFPYAPNTSVWYKTLSLNHFYSYPYYTYYHYANTGQ